MLYLALITNKIGWIRILNQISLIPPRVSEVQSLTGDSSWLVAPIAYTLKASGPDWLRRPKREHHLDPTSICTPPSAPQVMVWISLTSSRVSHGNSMRHFRQISFILPHLHRRGNRHIRLLDLHLHQQRQVQSD